MSWPERRSSRSAVRYAMETSGEAVGRWPVLAGGQDSLTDDRPVKTIGSYWPYLSTVWDYVHRAMPFGDAQSLSDDEVYAVTAYLLYLNDLVDEEFELTREDFMEVRLPNEANFFPDDRSEGEYALFSADPCMKNCKEGAKITMRAAVLDVTPEETKARQLREAVSAAKQGIAPRESRKVLLAASSLRMAVPSSYPGIRCPGRRHLNPGSSRLVRRHSGNARPATRSARAQRTGPDRI